MFEPYYYLYILFDITYNNIVAILTLFYSLVIHRGEIVQHFINVIIVIVEKCEWDRQYLC